LRAMGGGEQVKKIRIKPGQSKTIRDSKGRSAGRASVNRRGDVNIDIKQPKR
jgi:hypothetical protein